MQHADEANKIQKREEQGELQLKLDCPCVRCGSELVRNADLFQLLRCAGHFWSQEGIFEWVQKQVSPDLAATRRGWCRRRRQAIRFASDC